MKRIVVTDSAGQVHEFRGDDVRFWHEQGLCRVYQAGVDTRSSTTLASFTNPISVLVK